MQRVGWAKKDISSAWRRVTYEERWRSRFEVTATWRSAFHVRVLGALGLLFRKIIHKQTPFHHIHLSILYTKKKHNFLTNP